MELTDRELETIREKARAIAVGSITIEINELEGKLDIVAEDRMRVRARRRSGDRAIDERDGA